MLESFLGTLFAIGFAVLIAKFFDDNDRNGFGGFAV